MRLLVLVALLFPVPGWALYRIDTLAGRGYGDGGPALAAAVIGPADAITDSTGNVYFSEIGDQLVRRVDPNGIITTVAGNGSPGFSGDGGPATLASLHDPNGLGLDPTEKILFIVDNGGERVRRVDLTSGIITTFAGTGDAALPFDSSSASHGIGDGGPATSATFNQPIGVVVAANGDVYISERDEDHPAGVAHHPRIRRVDAATGVITLFAGGLPEGYNGEALPALQTALADPISMVFDAAGNLWFGELGNNRIRKIDTSANHVITTIAGNGSYPEPNDPSQVPFQEGVPATSASFYRPVRLALVPRGCGGPSGPACKVYFGDSGHHCVRTIDDAGNVVTVVNTPPNPTTSPAAGDSGDGGPAALARLETASVALGPANTVLVIDDTANRIRRYDPVAGTIVAFAGTGEGGFGGDNGPATRALLNRPTGLAVDGGGNLYVTEHDNHIVRRIANDASRTIVTWAGDGTAGGGGDNGSALSASFLEPTGLSFLPSGDLLVTDAGTQRLRRVTADHMILPFAGMNFVAGAADGPAASATFNTPLRTAVTPAGEVLVADFNNNLLRHIAVDGTVATVPAVLHQPAGVALAADGTLYVADFGSEKIVIVDPTTGIVQPLAGTGVETGTIDGPGGNPADDLGDGGPASGATFSDPTGISFDADGSLLVADQGNNLIRRIAVGGDGKLASTSVITTIAGDGRPTYAGDGGNALFASLARPTEALVLGDGRIVIADRGNQRVRVLTSVNSLCDVSCDDGDPCTVDTCDADRGCMHAVSPDSDGDGVCDAADDCPSVPDPNQDKPCPGGIPGGGCAAGDRSCVPGKGKAACLAETLVKGAAGKPAVRCKDGDPTCDADSTPGRCTFTVAWCFNNRDPRLKCSASGVGRFALRAAMAPRSAGRALVGEAMAAAGALGAGAAQGSAFVFTPPLAIANACTPPVNVTVALRGHASHPRPARAVLRAVAKGSGRTRGVATVKLVCAPG